MAMNHLVRIGRISRLMQIACTLYLVLAPVMLLVIWLSFETLGPRWQTLQQLPIRPEYVGTLNLVLGAMVSAIPLGLMMWGVWHLRILFGQFRRGEIFNDSAAAHLLVFARMLFITVLISPLISALLSLVLTMNNPPGQRAITLSTGSNDLAQLFIAGLLLAVAWVLREGHRIQSENEAFV
ncbi:MAG: DUF2975 domain-containing protein [Pseudomonadota bacterium]|nr:DUF2975 domain-containing protein [Pseudomonadota bacterium]